MFITFIRNYSHWRPGDDLEIPEPKGRKIIAQGYAEERTKKSKPVHEPMPVVETADAPTAEEDATVTPLIPRRGPGRPKKNAADDSEQ